MPDMTRRRLLGSAAGAVGGAAALSLLPPSVQRPSPPDRRVTVRCTTSSTS